MEKANFHVCDSPERIKQCLSCTEPVCYGGCPALRAIPAKQYNRKQAAVQPDENVHAVVRWLPLPEPQKGE